MVTEGTTAESAWAPLSHPVFRALWIASLVSNIGTWMQNVGAAWAMTSLSPSPLMVALVQSATSLPVFVVGLPAGAVADIVDRRRLLLVTQTWMLAAAALLSVLAFVDIMTPTTLLVLTFALGIGVAMNTPTWQAITADLVPQSELTRAVALNALPINIGRAVGPAIGGVLVAAAGPALVFALNAVSFVAVLAVVYRWRREAPRALLPAERVIGATRAGLRYARHAPPLAAVLVRTGVFIVCGSAFWALLPVIAPRDRGPRRRPVDRTRVLRRRCHPRPRRHAPLAAPRDRDERSHAVGTLARASPRRRAGSGRGTGPRRGRISRRSAPDGCLRGSHPRARADSPPRRGRHVGRLPGSGTKRALRRKLHRRVLARAPAPARARDGR